MTDTPRTTRDIVGRDEINDLEEILMLGPPPVDEIIREIQADGAIRFTWDYDQARPALEKLYAKAKRSQWDAATDIDWSQDVDPERIARGLLEAHPEMLLYQQKAKDDPTLPIYGWTDEQFVQLAIEYQTQFLSQIVHGEQGALMCTAKICEQVPWLEAKYYASTQVMDEARHVEVFSRYLDTKLRGHHPISGHLLALLEDVLGDPRWDITYLGMQIMIEGLALASFGFLHAITPDPLLKTILRYVMSDEARHVAFGVLSLAEAYEGMSAAEVKDRQEFAFEAGLAHAGSHVQPGLLGATRRRPSRPAALAAREPRHRDVRRHVVLQGRPQRQEARACSTPATGGCARSTPRWGSSSTRTGSTPPRSTPRSTPSTPRAERCATNGSPERTSRRVSPASSAPPSSPVLTSPVSC